MGTTGQISEGPQEETLNPQSLNLTPEVAAVFTTVTQVCTARIWAWVQTPARSLLSCGASAKSQDLSEPWYLHRKKGATMPSQKSSHKRCIRQRERVAGSPVRRHRQECSVNTDHRPSRSASRPLTTGSGAPPLQGQFVPSSLCQPFCICSPVSLLRAACGK